ncbi:MAG: Nucleotidyltransferase substrate binding protein, HI0074 family [Candidatus Beckwithbacteria bacterium GW2011_GWA2_43_10]|uniref:Nucleotidyltransferase substrate binding protein, HI0074 family n=1 Tax=Candidatus Beckwithbacteria bacterium GW2011_GWA2_43_10 TaxID=1618369 RepID=A0A0G1E6B1_9BACT|nr:MAG: Nucleotidyltransferase substrate binding protein, HI0074 family [Candidatus Beckwithbacteria bacterium GW2011_GWA2_43_10]
MSTLSQKLKMKKAKLLYADFIKASKRLKEIAAKPFSMVNRDATIKRFEFTFEVAWKLIKTIVERKSG